ncbi:MAG TPA: hypothetical protein VGI97_03005 [Gemmatimonadaceae bacterium]|jgi:hypothetical protein
MTEPEDLEDQRVLKLRERVRADSAAHPVPEELWPAIRERIEGAKIVALPSAEPAMLTARRANVRRTVAWSAAAVAAGAALFMFGRRTVPPALPAATVTNAADSTGFYEEQARILFNRLSLERALVRPEALASIDHDLHVVDSAIAELDAAVARDPANPVLRRLLASSYREKVDILKRVANAE